MCVQIATVKLAGKITSKIKVVAKSQLKNNCHLKN